MSYMTKIFLNNLGILTMINCSMSSRLNHLKIMEIKRNCTHLIHW